MKTKTCNIVYTLKKKIVKCSMYSVQRYIDKLIEAGYKIVDVVENKTKKITKKSKISNKINKHKYYKCKYSMYYNQCK